MGCKAGAEQLLVTVCMSSGVYPSAPHGLWERRSRRAGGDVSVPPCVPVLQPLAPGGWSKATGCRRWEEWERQQDKTCKKINLD